MRSVAVFLCVFAGVSISLSVSPFQVYLPTTHSVFLVACCTRKSLLALLVVLAVNPFCG